MTVLQKKRGFEWTKSVWAMTLMIWIGLFSYKAYDQMCSKAKESETTAQKSDSAPMPLTTDSTGSPQSAPPPEAAQPFPAFNKDWKGYSYSKIKAPRTKNTLKDKAK